jgi:hypothetical protein
MIGPAARQHRRSSERNARATKPSFAYRPRSSIKVSVTETSGA